MGSPVRAQTFAFVSQKSEYGDGGASTRTTGTSMLTQRGSRAAAGCRDTTRASVATVTDAGRSIGIEASVTPVGPYSYTAAGKIERKVLQVVLFVPKRENGPRLPRFMLSVVFVSITPLLLLVSVPQAAKADCGYPGV